MKRILINTKLFILLLCLTTQVSFSQDNEPFSLDTSPLSNPTSPVMDYAGVLDSATQQRLEEKVINFKKESNPSVELAVAIVKTTGERPIFDYSLAVARGWGIGSREDDNPSALLFIAVEDRKYFTQVSRNLEDELPDGIVGNLQRQNLVPEFKKGNYGKGIEDTIDSYITRIKAKQSGEEIADTDEPSINLTGPGISNCFRFFVCLVILIIILIIIFSSSSGGGGGKRRKSGGSGWIFLPTGSSGGWSSGGSSSWGGGGSSGGGWGGFGGGGDFGGGGAGGGW